MDLVPTSPNDGTFVLMSHQGKKMWVPIAAPTLGEGLKVDMEKDPPDGTEWRVLFIPVNKST